MLDKYTHICSRGLDGPGGSQKFELGGGVGWGVHRSNCPPVTFTGGGGVKFTSGQNLRFFVEKGFKKRFFDNFN